MERVFAELGETSRRQILAELRSGEKNVSELVKATGLKQPNVSNHLARMRLRGVVKGRKVGREVVYSLGSPEIEAILHSVFASQTPVDAMIEWPELARKYAKAASVGEEQECAEILEIAFRASAPLLDIYQDLIAPAMALIGSWYKVAAIDEAQEHMASSITERMMMRAMQVAGPVRRTGMLAVLGCAPENHHVIGLRMVSDFLRLAGWKTLFLGSNVPIKSFVATVEQHAPHMVLTSCGSEEGLASTLELVAALATLKSSKRAFKIGVGGAIAGEFGPRYLEAGADFSAASLREFAEQILPSVKRAAS